MTRSRLEPLHPRRDFLISLLLRCREAGFSVEHLELSDIDEVLVFEFISPSADMRSRGFRLFNLPVRLGADFSSVALAGGKRRRFELARMIDFEFVEPDRIRRAVANFPPGINELGSWQGEFRKAIEELDKPKVKVQARDPWGTAVKEI